MSVQSQINRISGAVSAALTALSEKGVEVPAGTKVDGLAALIAAIEAGGGSGGDFATEIATGTITPDEDILFEKNISSNCNPLVIVHNAQKIPKVVVLYNSSSDATLYLDFLVEICTNYNENQLFYQYAAVKAYSNFNTKRKENISVKKAHYWTETTVFLGQFNYGCNLKAGNTYTWIAFA